MKKARHSPNDVFRNRMLRKWSGKGLRLEELEPRVAPAADLFVVPPTTDGAAAQVRFTWNFSEAAQQNEFGVFAVDDSTGTIAGVTPGSANYAQTALSRAQVLFSRGATAGAVTNLTFNPGQLLALYLVPDGSTADVLAGRNTALFSIDEANANLLDYVRANDTPGVRTFSWDDQLGGGDRDFNDAVLSISALNGIPGGVTVATGDFNNDGIPDVVAGAGPGSEARVKVISGADGSELRNFIAYDGFLGGVNVAVGDVDGDGTDDVITGAWVGSGHVRVFSGADGSLLQNFFAYDATSQGGVFVAAGDINGDGLADIITGSGAGAPQLVRVFDGSDASEILSFTAYDGFAGGVRVAAGDVNADGQVDIITGTGSGTQANIKAFDGFDGTELLNFTALGSFSGGVFVASGDKNNDGFADIIVGAGAGTGPQVQVFSGIDGSLLSGFMAYDVNFGGGVSVADPDFDGDGFGDIITGAGRGVGDGHIKIFSGATGAELASFLAFGSTPTTGAMMFQRPPDSPSPPDQPTDPDTPTDPDEPGDTTPPTGTFVLTNDTGDSATDLLTNNPETRLTLVDASPITTLRAGLDNTTPANFTNILNQLQSNNTVLFTSTLLRALNGNVNLSDGQRTIRVLVGDSAGNTNTLTFTFTLDTTPPPLSFAIIAADDTDTPGDFRTTKDMIRVEGSTLANRIVTFTLPNGTTRTTTAAANGSFAFDNVPLAFGPNGLQMRVTDPAGNLQTYGQTYTRPEAPTSPNGIATQNLTAGDPATTINLFDVFDEEAVVVRFNTILGDIDVELFDNDAPLTVANFLKYVNDTASNGSDYTNAIFHRLVPGFVLQGGGFEFVPGGTPQIIEIPDDGTVDNEFKLANSENTIAMAKLGGDPDSASNEFFFSLGNNSSNLDNQNGGFTVFGQIVTGQSVLDQLAAGNVINRSNFNSAFGDFPVYNGYNGTNFPNDLAANNLALIESITLLQEGGLTFTASSNDTDVVTVSVNASGVLSLTPVAPGSTTVSVTATDRDGLTATVMFTVNVAT